MKYIQKQLQKIVTFAYSIKQVGGRVVLFPLALPVYSNKTYELLPAIQNVMMRHSPSNQTAR